MDPNQPVHPHPTQFLPNRSTPANQPTNQVDASEHRDLGSRFDVSGFPTLKFVPKGSKDAVAYESGREVADLVAFMNDKAGLAYTADGGLKPSYGRVEALDALLPSAGALRCALIASIRTGLVVLVSKLAD